MEIKKKYLSYCIAKLRNCQRGERTIKEFNNRKKAKKLAEYITGKELRQYLARKVEQYVGKDITVFDGAVGSGQLEEYIKPKFLYGVEIQEESCRYCKENYPDSEIKNMSFFEYDSEIQADCVVMNYPFSLKFNDLTQLEKENIQKYFPWKKSGVVDDIFILQSLKYTKRYAFYIGFPGITYRKTESKLRELIGNQLKELNYIQNAFEDTSIEVIFMVIDKEKTDTETFRELYDCKTDKQICKETVEVEDRWSRIVAPVEEEIIDIEKLEKEIEGNKKKRRKLEDELDDFIKNEIKPLIGE